MYHPCIASIVSVRTRGLHSFSSNENPYCSNERYPFICSPRVYCSCCCSSMYRVPLSSSYCYSLGGARQSSLIQWAPCRKLVLRCFDPCFHTRLPASNVCRSCCCDKVCSFREKSEGGSKQRLRKSMVFEERTERNDFEIANEAEVVLDLLTEGIGEECLHVTRDARRLLKKAAVVEKANGEFRNKHWYKMKRVDPGILENESTSVNGSLLISRKKGGGREETFVREDEEGDWLRKENSRQMLKKEHEHTFLTTERVRKNNEREVLLKEKSHGNKGIQESESKLRNEMNVRARTEEREELLRRKEDRQKLRKDGSSCSSYYSLSSTGDYDSDNDMKHRQEEYTRDSSSGLERSSRSTEALNREVKEDKMREDYREERGINVTKKRSEKELYTGSSIVESDFRKKSEKKLTDISVKEIESRKNNLQKEAISLKEQDSNYRKSSDYPVKYDDRKEKSTRSTKFDEQAVDAVSVQSERKLKYKQLLDIQKTQDIDVQNSYSLNTYSGKRDSKVASQEIVGEHVSITGISTRTDEHQSSSTQVAEVSESQKIDVSKTSVSHQRFEEHSANFSSAEKDAVKQHHGNEQVSGMVALWRESEILSKKQCKSGLKSSDEIITQDQNVDLASGSMVLSAGLLSQAHTGVLKTGQSIIGSDKTTKISRTHSGIEHVVDRVKDGQPVGQTSVRISQEDLTFAARFEKSSAHHIDEFVDQVRHEISSSGIKKETKTRTTEIMHEGKQFQKKVVPLTSGDSKAKEQHTAGDDLFSGAAGPSDEMWKLNEPSTRKQSKEEVHDDAIKAGDIVIKRTGRSLWNVLVDVFRLGWSPRSESHHSGRNSVGKSPTNQSTRSETWFSTHETEENEEANRAREGLPKDHQGEKIRFPVEECSSPSVSEGRLKLQEGNAMTISPLTTISLPSAEEISGGNSVATSSPVMIESSTSSPTSGGRYQVIQGIMEAGEANASSSTSMLNTGLAELSESTVNEGKLKSRKLQRKDQIPRDRFDEWEEAYNIEAEQRKTDESFMREAIREAQQAADNWEVPVGAVLVHNGKIIARGCNLVEQLRDSTAHAEMICIREASKILRTWRLSETQLYVTLEPCPMCAGAILQARIDTIVWGAPNKLLGADGSWIRLFPNGDGGNGLEHSDKPPAPVHPFHPKIRIRRGVLASECADTMQQFFKLRRKRKDSKSESPSPPPSCLPLSNRPSRFLAKMHDAFSLMFYL